MAFRIQKFREILFQLLYSHEIGHPNEEDMIPLIMKEVSVTRKTVREAQEKLQALLEKLPEIDEIIAKTSVSYSFERIQNVEKNILRLGVFELIYEADIPPKVAIAEAMRLARKFGSPEAASFVNALLDNIYKAQQGIHVDAHELTHTSETLLKSEEKTKDLPYAKTQDDQE
jgi:N utilization substance protein B